MSCPHHKAQPMKMDVQGMANYYKTRIDDELDIILQLAEEHNDKRITKAVKAINHCMQGQRMLRKHVIRGRATV